jgi:hypothetical protein
MNYDDKITKKSNLSENDSLSIYDNKWAAQQNHKVFEVFFNFIKKIKPKQILEIGTSLGGFTCYMKYVTDVCEIDCEILSLDIIEHPWFNDIRDYGIDIKVENVFDKDYTEVKQYIIDFIKREGTTIVLCDGGNKIKEFKLLSKFIKSGDFIMAHDYVSDKDNFKKNYLNKIWNWHEIEDYDIEESCLENNLESFDNEIFDSIVWVCKLKKQ